MLQLEKRIATIFCQTAALFSVVTTMLIIILTKQNIINLLPVNKFKQQLDLLMHNFLHLQIQIYCKPSRNERLKVTKVADDIAVIFGENPHGGPIVPRQLQKPFLLYII